LGSAAVKEKEMDDHEGWIRRARTTKGIGSLLWRVGRVLLRKELGEELEGRR